MYKLYFTERFSKKYKKYIKNNKSLEKLVLDVLEIVRINPYCNSLKSHLVIVRGFGKVWSSRINGDIRIIWIIEKDKIIVLLDIGGHSGGNKVYK